MQRNLILCVGGGLCWERLGDERNKLRELPPECLCFPWEVGYSVGRRVWGLAVVGEEDTATNSPKEGCVWR